MLSDEQVVSVVLSAYDKLNSLDIVDNKDIWVGTLFEYLFMLGGSAIGQALEIEIINELNRLYPNQYRKGNSREPDIVCIELPDDSLEVKITTGSKISGNKTSATTKNTKGKHFIFVFFSKNEYTFGELIKITKAFLNPDDWIKSSGENTQMAYPDESKQTIIYQKGNDDEITT